MPGTNHGVYFALCFELCIQRKQLKWKNNFQLCASVETLTANRICCARGTFYWYVLWLFITSGFYVNISSLTQNAGFVYLFCQNCASNSIKIILVSQICQYIPLKCELLQNITSFLSLQKLEAIGLKMFMQFQPNKVPPVYIH